MTNTVATAVSLSEALPPGLDDFDPAVRRRALEQVVADGGRPEPGTAVNLHCHTFYSYNAYGYSPTHFAVLARRAGLAVAGIVDFDVLDGLDEFLEASRLLGLKGVVSLESRVFVPELADRVINSPGEPGIAYHMGVGFTRADPHPFLAEMRAVAERRVREMLASVNPYTEPVTLDYEQDVRPLTPGGNATERHLCAALERKARAVFPDETRRAAFWRDKLGACPPAGVELQGLIRARMLKQGGVGYALPDRGAFPTMADMNRFVLEAGAIPTLAWLDGTSEGESDLDRLLAVARSTGVAAVNVIPDRNYTRTPSSGDSKLANLHRLIAAAVDNDLPVVVGTEMNKAGQRLVDDFDAPELAPFVLVFLRGAHIVYGHSVLRPHGLGYLGDWAAGAFASTAEKNAFFERVGRDTAPAAAERVRGLPDSPDPEVVLDLVTRSRS